MAQQCTGIGVATAKFPEHVGRRQASAERQDRVPVASSDLADGFFVLQPRFLEGREGIGTHHFRPFVAVVAGRIAAAEDVREARKEAVFGQRCEHRGPLGHAALHVEGGFAGAEGASVSR